MRMKSLSLLMIPAAGIVGAVLLTAGAPHRDGARLLDQVVAKLQREAIDSLSLDDIYERAARGLVRQVDDPYAALFSPSEMQRFSRESLGNSYGGVGLLIEDQEGQIVVTKVFPDTPGEQGGVVAGDRLLEVDGAPVRGLKLDQVSRRLLGKPGTPVDLALAREGSSEALRFRLTRATVHVPGVPYAMIFPGNVGYVSLQRFNDVAGEERLLRRLQRQRPQQLRLQQEDEPVRHRLLVPHEVAPQRRRLGLLPDAQGVRQGLVAGSVLGRNGGQQEERREVCPDQDTEQQQLAARPPAAPPRGRRGLARPCCRPRLHGRESSPIRARALR